MKNVETFYPLSPMQEAMLFETLAGGGEVYTLQHRFHIEGPIDTTAFRTAWDRLAVRHAALRTYFLWEKLREPVQVVRKEVVLPLAVIEAGDRTPEAAERLVETVVREDRAKGFAVDRAPLARGTLIALGSDRGPREHLFVFTFYHLILDGWSVSLLLRELFETYRALVAGEETPAEEAPQFGAYVAWLRQRPPERGEAFWRRELAGFTEPNELPERSPGEEPVGGDRFPGIDLPRPVPLSDAEQAAVRRAGLSLNTLAQGAWALAIAGLTGDTDVVFGAIVLGRPEELEGSGSMVGVFINNLPLRARLRRDEAVGEWLEDLQLRHTESWSHAYQPLAQIRSWSEVPRDRPLFDSYVNFDRARASVSAGERRPSGDGSTARGGGLRISAPSSTEQGGFPLLLNARPGGDGLVLHLTYDRQRYLATTAERLLARTARAASALASALAETGGRRTLGELGLLTSAERHQLQWEWNDPGFDPLPGETLLDRLWHWERERPEAPAVSRGEEVLDYRSYAALVRRVAVRLRALGVRMGSVVAVCLERRVEAPAVFLGARLAGGAYMPLDPAYPPARLLYQVEDSASPVLVVEGSTREALPEDELAGLDPPPTVIDLSELVAEGETDGEAPDWRLPPDAPAYVLYTSGSTGKPKGVAVTGGNLDTLLASVVARGVIGPDDTMLGAARFAFDISVADLYLPLWVGARSEIAPKGAAGDPDLLASCLRRSEATVFQATPATWGLLTATDWEGRPDLEVLSAGELLPPNLARKMYERSGGGNNFYGPTETTIFATAWRLRPSEEVPIGRPLYGYTCYVVDAAGELAATGVAGEIVIGGHALAQGYLGKPGRTADSFIPDPFGHRPGARLYRSRDMGRWRADGEMEILGRSDHQVKLRGFRIELGELETVAAGHPSVRHAVAGLVGEGDGRRLVLHLVAGEGSDPEALEAEVRSNLERALPEYMLPSAVRFDTSFPLTRNGKVDREAVLAAAAEAAPEAGPKRGGVPPRTDLERRLAGLWEEVLGVEGIGVQDDFLSLGGHSLLAVRLTSLVARELGREVPLATLLQGGRTIEEMALALERDDESEADGPLVVLKAASAERPPFFCVHPVGGTVFGYQALADQLHPEQPFLGLQAPGLQEIAGRPYVPIEEMAADYLEAVRGRQPQGPYLLGGHSFGGYVAVEMARQLREEGAEVALVALLDTMAPAGVIDAGAILDPDYAVVLTSAVNDYARQVGAEARMELDDLRGIDRSEQARRIIATLGEAGVLTSSFEEGSVRRLIEGHRTRLESLYHWKPPVYSGRLVLLRAEEREVETLDALPPAVRAIFEDPAAGWEPFARQGVEVYPVPGHHGSMLIEPNVRALARNLQRVIDRAVSRLAPPLGHREDSQGEETLAGRT